jgi:hypothetical protein
VLAEPITRLLYERGEFDAQVDRAGRRGARLVQLLAAVQRREPAADPDVLLPPAPVAADDARRCSACSSTSSSRSPCTRRSGSAGSWPAPSPGTLTTTVTQFLALRRELAGRLEAGATLAAAARITAASALLALVAYAVHRGLDGALGDGPGRPGPRRRRRASPRARRRTPSR